MNVRVKATNYEMTEATSNYIDERITALQKLLGSDESQSRCEVEVGVDAGGQRHGDNMYFAEFHIIYPGGSVRATNHSQSINGAIDDAREEVARQLRRERKLHIRMWRKSGAAFKRLIRAED